MNEERKKQKNGSIVRFPCHVDQLECVHIFIKEICENAPGNSAYLSIELGLAVHEVFCNLLKHGHSDLFRKEVVIASELTEEGIYLTISDQGTSFDSSRVVNPSFAGDQEGGFGLVIIQRVADKMTYFPKGEKDPWNHLQLFKRYPNQPGMQELEIFFEEEQMEVVHHVQGSVLILKPQRKSLDVKNASYFKEDVLECAQKAGLSNLVFDLRELEFIDSAGLGTFLSIQRALNRQGGELKLAHLSPSIRTMFEIVSMHRIFDIFSNTEEAIQSF